MSPEDIDSGMGHRPPRSVAPSISVMAFDCPHCGAYTSQIWYDLLANKRDNDSKAPGVVDSNVLDGIHDDKNISDEIKQTLKTYFENMLAGLVFLERLDESVYTNYDVNNINLSQCFSCNKVAVWIKDRLVFPAQLDGPAPNPDFSTDIRADYLEASQILSRSPRGAAALLRLAIEKLCIELGENGKNIDENIASLVKKGLSPLVQKALDAVRVIGNESVHPGTLDLNDDVDTASKLFELVNIIAEQMISNPKRVEEVYSKIPPKKREAIEKRDSSSSK